MKHNLEDFRKRYEQFYHIEVRSKDMKEVLGLKGGLPSDMEEYLRAWIREISMVSYFALMSAEEFIPHERPAYGVLKDAIKWIEAYVMLLDMGKNDKQTE
jgi:hypothetical protein